MSASTELFSQLSVSVDIEGWCPPKENSSHICRHSCWVVVMLTWICSTAECTFTFGWRAAFKNTFMDGTSEGIYSLSTHMNDACSTDCELCSLYCGCGYRALFCGENDFSLCLKESFPPLKTRMLTRLQWCKIRRLMGKPRRYITCNSCSIGSLLCK